VSLTKGLQHKYQVQWQRVVNHPFVQEMGDGDLPTEKFRSYFLQDYIFVKDLVSITAMGVSKAPNLYAASMLNRFLDGILNPENDLFQRAFAELGAHDDEHSTTTATPTTQAFGDFIVRVGLEGTFEDILVVLHVTEGTYLDWGTRLIEEGKNPDNTIYREWIQLHGPEVLGDLVAWISKCLDKSSIGSIKARTEWLFLTTLRYEYMFWEAAYRGEEWTT